MAGCFPCQKQRSSLEISSSPGRMSGGAEAFISALNEEAAGVCSPARLAHKAGGSWARALQGHPSGGRRLCFSDLENTLLRSPALISLSPSKLLLVLGFHEEVPVRGDTHGAAPPPLADVCTFMLHLLATPWFPGSLIRKTPAS